MTFTGEMNEMSLIEGAMNDFLKEMVKFKSLTTELEDSGVDLAKKVGAFLVPYPHVGVSMDGHTGCAGSGDTCGLTKLAEQQVASIKATFALEGCKNEFTLTGVFKRTPSSALR